jgi:hypothetical protein
VQCAFPAAAGDVGVGRAGLLEGLRGGGRDEGIDLRLERVDALADERLSPRSKSVAAENIFRKRTRPVR